MSLDIRTLFYKSVLAKKDSSKVNGTVHKLVTHTINTKIKHTEEKVIKK